MIGLCILILFILIFNIAPIVNVFMLGIDKKNLEVYNVEQRQINVVYFSVVLTMSYNVKTMWVTFNIEFHIVAQRRENVVNMIKNLKNKPPVKSNKIFLKIFWIRWTQNFDFCFKILFILLLILRLMMRRLLATLKNLN